MPENPIPLSSQYLIDIEEDQSLAREEWKKDGRCTEPGCHNITPEGTLWNICTHCFGYVGYRLSQDGRLYVT